MENSDEKTFKRRILIGCTSAGILLVAGIICLQFFLNAEPPKPSVLSFGAFSTIGDYDFTRPAYCCLEFLCPRALF